MERMKGTTLTVRISQEDRARLLELVDKTSKETNVTLSQGDMIAKLIRDASAAR